MFPLDIRLEKQHITEYDDRVVGLIFALNCGVVDIKAQIKHLVNYVNTTRYNPFVAHETLGGFVLTKNFDDKRLNVVVTKQFDLRTAGDNSIKYFPSHNCHRYEVSINSANAWEASLIDSLWSFIAVYPGLKDGEVDFSGGE